MSLNASITPIPVQIIPHDLPIYIWVIIAIFFAIMIGLVALAYHKTETRLRIYVMRTPDKRLNVKYYYGMGSTIGKGHLTTEEAVTLLTNLVEEWK